MHRVSGLAKSVLCVHLSGCRQQFPSRSALGSALCQSLRHKTHSKLKIHFHLRSHLWRRCCEHCLGMPF